MLPVTPATTDIHERLGQFIERARATVVPGDDESFFAMRSEFDALVADGTVWTAVLNDALAKIVGDPNYEGGGRWLMRRLLIHYSPQFSLSLATHFFELAAPQQRIEENQDFLLAPGGHVMLAFLHDQPIKLQRYCLPPGASFDIFDPAVRLLHAGEETIAPGQRLDINGHHEAIDFDMPEHAVAVVMNSAPCVSQIWSVQSRSLQALGASLANENTSIIMTMINELARVRHRPATEVIEQLTHNPDHNIRWSAMKCLGRLDGDVALARLEQLSNDPHPFVSSAARRTLENLQSR